MEYDNFIININYKDYAFNIYLNKEDIIHKNSGVLSFKCSYEELNEIINKLNILKSMVNDKL